MESKPAKQIGTWRRAKGRMRSEGSRKYHYLWDFKDGNSGFISHTKRNGKWFSKKYKMFIDSNGNQILDDSDEIISKGKFEKGFREERLGRLLSKNTYGIITAKPYQQMDHLESNHSDDKNGELMSKMGEVGINALGIEHMNLLNSSGDMVLHDHGAAYMNMIPDHSMMM